MVSQPVCGASGPGYAARAHAPGLPHRGALPGRAAAHSLPIAGRAVRALGHVPERLKEGAASAHCLEADRGCDRRCITLHAVVHGSSVGQKMVSAKRGFSPEYPVSLMMHWRKGGHGGVCGGNIFKTQMHLDVFMKKFHRPTQTISEYDMACRGFAIITGEV